MNKRIVMKTSNEWDKFSNENFDDSHSDSIDDEIIIIRLRSPASRNRLYSENLFYIPT